MCGIVGFTDFSRNISNDIDILGKMTERLAHRGPDDQGFWHCENAALGHRRLTVVDPEGGRQPMEASRGESRYVIVYNGELYNTEDIRQQLISKGWTFKGWSDTEVLLDSYIEWGEDCLEKLNGIFAFAIWDVQRKSLFLARDRIGVKPLFYSRRGGLFLFASEIKAILAHPSVPARLDREGLAEVFVTGPARTPGCGVFSGIWELKPGYCMTVDEKGERIKQYWSLDSHAHEDDFDKTARTVRELVQDAVTRQLVSDVPLCVLLSGGLDSSAISAVASEAYRKRGERIETFSIDYAGNDKYFTVNEFQPDPDAPWVKKVSDYLGTLHSVCMIDTPELTDALFPSVIARDIPGMTDIDSSLLLFSRWIKKRATVGLSGECADEVFGGYPWFYRPAEPGSASFPWSRRLSDRIRLFSQDLIEYVDPVGYAAARYQEASDEVPSYAGDSPEEAEKRKLFYFNITRWMPTLLDRKDRMSMAAGLELRVPFCDHRLVEYMWNVPWSMKYHNGREKGLLRHALEGMLPEDVLWRKKSPYPKTHNPAYLEAVRRLILAVLDDQTSPLLPFINKENVRALALSIKPDTHIPWFGQLMNAPQLLAFLVQIDFWLREYHVSAV